MRYNQRRRTRTSKSSQFARAFLVLVILGVCIYIAIATTAGNFIAQNIIAPAIEFVDSKIRPDKIQQAEKQDIEQDKGQDENILSLTQTSVKKPPSKSEQITIEPKTVYALQLGAFSSEENAKVEADNLKTRGAGGYVFLDGHYRVFASMYYDEQDAQKVKEKLLSENQMESSIYTLSIPGAEIKVTAGEDKLEAVKEAFNIFEQSQQSIFELCNKYDKKELGREQINVELRKILENTNKPIQTLKGVGSGEIGDELLKALESMVNNIDQCLNSNDDDAVYSSKLKYMHMDQVGSFYKLSTLINSLT